jgi:SAM-dependent methyltransferase
MWIRALTERFSVTQIIGLDLSSGMLHDARRLVGADAVLVAGGVEQLPFPDRSFDVVLCLWMLYHVKDQEGALRELRRVLRPEGKLLATTNRSALGSLGVTATAAVSEVLGCPPSDWLPPLSFAGGNGAEIIGQVFGTVESEEVVTAFAVDTPEPILGILRSTKGPVEICLGRTVDWHAVERHVTDAIRAAIADQGAYRSEQCSVSFLATA